MCLSSDDGKSANGVAFWQQPCSPSAFSKDILPSGLVASRDFWSACISCCNHLVKGCDKRLPAASSVASFQETAQHVCLIERGEAKWRKVLCRARMKRSLEEAAPWWLILYLLGWVGSLLTGSYLFSREGTFAKYPRPLPRVHLNWAKLVMAAGCLGFLAFPVIISR